ncbi:hypothetical protein ACFWF7_43815 [Nocardia sp. NPDC060256]|uniref:hypothetical protein n=1 Tax=unclassified Nocardia TaxID=2637762 RepID=UPI0036505015
MSWKDQHARTEVLRTVLARAALDPADPQLFTGIPDLERLFGDVDGVLLALRYRWNIHLEAKLDQALAHGRPSTDAYLELAAEQPALYAVLEAQYRRRIHAPEVMAR